MMISYEQARLAAEYIKARRGDEVAGLSRAVAGDLPPGFIERVRENLAGTPDLRADRVAAARGLLASQPSADEVAGKMLSRIVSDSLR